MSRAEVLAYLRSIGSSGGKAGTGKSKRRGSKAYYRELAAKAAKARKRKSRLESSREESPP